MPQLCTSAAVGDEEVREDRVEHKHRCIETLWDWRQRTTKKVEAICREMGLESWVHAQRRRKWRWAGHASRMDRGRWASKMLEWVPQGCRGRPQGGPKKRWEDVLNSFGATQSWGKGEWRLMAAEREGWKKLEDEFVSFGNKEASNESSDEEDGTSPFAMVGYQ